MSFCSDVTRATFTPGPSSSSKRVTVGPIVIPTSVVSTPCCCSDSCRTRPRASTSARLIDWASARCSSVTGGSVHELVAGPSSSDAVAVEAAAAVDAAAGAAGSVERSAATVGSSSKSFPASYGPAGPRASGVAAAPAPALATAASSSGSSSLRSDEISLSARWAARPIGTATNDTPRPVPEAIVRSDAWVISITPTSSAPSRSTTEPTSASKVRSGSPTIQPTTPPASLTPSTEKPSGPLAMCRRPRPARPTNVQPNTSRHGLDERPSRISTMPSTTSSGGTR